MPIELNNRGDIVVTGAITDSTPREIPIGSDDGVAIINELVEASGKTREEIISMLDDGPFEP